MSVIIGQLDVIAAEPPASEASPPGGAEPGLTALELAGAIARDTQRRRRLEGD